MKIKIPTYWPKRTVGIIRDRYPVIGTNELSDRDIIWSICADVQELVSFLQSKGFSKRKAFIVFCTIAWNAVRKSPKRKKRKKT